VTDALEELEAFQRKVKRDWEEERDRITKQARRNGIAVKRLEELMDGGELGAEGGEGEDAGLPDARGRGAPGLPPVREDVARIPWRGGRTG